MPLSPGMASPVGAWGVGGLGLGVGKLRDDVPLSMGAVDGSHGLGSAGPRLAKGWEEVSPLVRAKVAQVVESSGGCIQLGHFDAGVRHWLVQLTNLFGEDQTLQGLSTIQSATNLLGVRNMRAFITTRLIDLHETLVFKQDPRGYASQHLLPDQFAMLEAMVLLGQGLQWHHFDPKVLETIRSISSLEYTSARLARLTAKELATVQNIPAYIFTLLSKRGRTAKQAAAAKSAAETLSLTHSSLAASLSPSSLPPSLGGLAAWSPALSPARLGGVGGIPGGIPGGARPGRQAVSYSGDGEPLMLGSPQHHHHHHHQRLSLNGALTAGYVPQWGSPLGLPGSPAPLLLSPHPTPLRSPLNAMAGSPRLVASPNPPPPPSLLTLQQQLAMMHQLGGRGPGPTQGYAAPAPAQGQGQGAGLWAPPSQAGNSDAAAGMVLNLLQLCNQGRDV
ncbi:hypothetical protein V8C86DRAFT_2856518 [Haematococcus lacustris]